MVYHISYDLCKPHKDYDSIYKTIKEIGSWCHPVDSTWYVDTFLNAEEVRDRIKTIMDNDDKLIVTVAGAPGAWYNLDDDVAQWLKRHLI